MPQGWTRRPSSHDHASLPSGQEANLKHNTSSWADVCCVCLCEYARMSHPQVTMFIHRARQQKSWTCKVPFAFGKKAYASILAKDGAIIVYRAGLVDFAPSGLLLKAIQLTCSKRKQTPASFSLGRFHLQHSGRIRPTAPGSKAALPRCLFKDCLLYVCTWQRFANSCFCCGDQLVVLMANCQKLFPRAPIHRKHGWQHIARSIWQISGRVSNAQATPFDPIIWALQPQVLDPKDTPWTLEQEKII